MTMEMPTIWAHKPWWCKPWSILLTGVGAVIASWMLVGLWWISALVAVAVLFWWTLFLVLMPRAWQASLQSPSGEAVDSEG